MDRIDQSVAEAVRAGKRVRAIVTFDRPQEPEDLDGYEVVFNLPSIDAVVLVADHTCLSRLEADPHVVRVEADGEVVAFD